MSISERILFLLDKAGKTQKDLADYTGISASAISDWKKKGTNPSSEKLIKICEFLNVSVYWLLTGNDYELTSQKLSDIERELLIYFKKLPPIVQGKLLGNLEMYLNGESVFLSDSKSKLSPSENTFPDIA